MTAAQNSEKTAKKPRGKPFSKGQTGNPGGRPKRTAEEVDLIEACKEKTPDALDVITKLMETAGSERTKLAAAMAIIERAYGKPIQPTDNKHAGEIGFKWLTESS